MSKRVRLLVLLISVIQSSKEKRFGAVNIYDAWRLGFICVMLDIARVVRWMRNVFIAARYLFARVIETIKNVLA